MIAKTRLCRVSLECLVWFGGHRAVPIETCKPPTRGRNQKRPCSLVFSKWRTEPDQPGSSCQRPLGLSSRVAFALVSPPAFKKKTLATGGARVSLIAGWVRGWGLVGALHPAPLQRHQPRCGSALARP